ncbi:twin-arginine translocation signal domain-containing protein, partial [Paracoccaceae bacterium]|nr:twin-arginine translocation signal domain-containing protein [Paracoccaceae bacterium]
MTLKLNRRHFLSTATAGAVAASLPLSARAATPLTMQAAWINDAEFAGYFLGIDEGYYSDAGLDLTYLSGG